MKPSIYALTDPRTGAVRYIGKANDPAKRLKGHMRDARRRQTPVYAWINKLVRLGMAPGLLVLEADCADWRESERRLIAEARARGDRLLNVADGGDEPHCPPEVRKANSDRLNARGELHGYNTMMRRCGQALRHLRSLPHRQETADKMEVAMGVMRSWPIARRIEAGNRWMARPTP